MPIALTSADTSTAQDCHAGPDPDNIRITAVERDLSITEIWHTDQCPTYTVEQILLEAYRWAAGTRTAAPVTAAATAGPLGPCRAQLLAECQAAAVALRTAWPPTARRPPPT
ncbi:hypothetical protein ACIG5E_38420 [Kitasatospora sp. NPDC053057]|uniref:hypothetical protein n=1 Tax=Kitasatospora sp. NPDC053057 TaxID=3364062 RepID=UPI0037C860A7